MPAPRSGFLEGLLIGVAVTLASAALGLYVLNMLGLVAVSVIHAPSVQHLLGWAYRNLGLSLLPFGAAGVLFVHSLTRLRARLAAGRPVEEVAQAEHLVDVWTSLFFGIGVLWTAIGMRSALLYALGEPGTLGQVGADAILQRLVDGGILLALSTTIFGGAGGYLMRVWKALTVGAALKRYYDRLYRGPGDEVQATLNSIEQHLKTLVTRETGHAAPALGE